MEGVLIGKFMMDPGWEIQMDGLSEFFYGSQLGDLTGTLAGKFEKAPRWDNHEVFWSGNGKVKWSVKWMEAWLGSLKEDVTQANGCI